MIEVTPKEALEAMTVKELDELLDAAGLPKDGLKADKVARLDNIIETSKTGEKPEVKDYEIRMWAGKIPVYICSHCGRQHDDRDRMILHVLEHYPKEKQEMMFNKLVKDDDNGK
jgi:hypothetical protein